MAARFALAAGLVYVLLGAAAQAQTYQRLHVRSFSLRSDVASPRLEQPFHVTLTIHVTEDVPQLRNVFLPTFFGAEELGDEQQIAHGPRGTAYRETLTLVAHETGSLSISPAYLDAIDARDGKPKRFISNGLQLRVGDAGPSRVWSVLLTIALVAIEVLLVAAALFVIAAVFWRRARHEPATPDPPQVVAPTLPQPVLRNGVLEAFEHLRCRRDRSAVLQPAGGFVARRGCEFGRDARRRAAARACGRSTRAFADERGTRRVHRAHAFERCNRGGAVQPAVLTGALGETIVGQHEVVESLVLALIAGGHVLLEGPPGLAKTLACRALAAALDGEFKRVQFTPDLLPADIVGTRIFDQRESAFTTVLGPIFANVVLADEINRAPAKVQSALLEAMQERQVTIGPQTHPLPDPFIVLATMNPLDADGTYALPFAQLDRFLLKVRVDMPTAAQERAILDRFAIRRTQPVQGVATLEHVLAWRERAREVHIEEKIKQYVVDLVLETRKPTPYVEHGASPRATLALVFMSRAKALLAGRDFVLPDDVRDVAPLVLRHRIVHTHRVAVERIDPEELLASTIAAVRAP